MEDLDQTQQVDYSRGLRPSQIPMGLEVPPYQVLQLAYMSEEERQLDVAHLASGSMHHRVERYGLAVVVE
jgi:hypothetical protein